MSQDRKQEIFSKVKSIIAEQLSIDEAKITPQSKLNEDLGADSLDATELVMVLEEEYKIEILDDDAEKMKTVEDILTYLDKKSNNINGK